MRLISALLLGAMLLSACRSRTRHGEPGRGSLSASWVGSDTGKLAASPRAYWCADSGRLELFAEKGDLGLGLVVYPVQGLEPGRYPIFDPRTDSVRRPGAAVAVRWFTERTMQGFQSDSGALELRRTGDALAGDFRIRMRGVSEGRSLRLTGRFSGATPGGCSTDSVPPPVPSH